MKKSMLQPTRKVLVGLGAAVFSLTLVFPTGAAVAADAVRLAFSSFSATNAGFSTPTRLYIASSAVVLPQYTEKYLNKSMVTEPRMLSIVFDRIGVAPGEERERLFKGVVDNSVLAERGRCGRRRHVREQ